MNKEHNSEAYVADLERAIASESSADSVDKAQIICSTLGVPPTPPYRNPGYKPSDDPIQEECENACFRTIATRFLALSYFIASCASTRNRILAAARWSA